MIVNDLDDRHRAVVRASLDDQPHPTSEPESELSSTLGTEGMEAHRAETEQSLKRRNLLEQLNPLNVARTNLGAPCARRSSHVSGTPLEASRAETYLHPRRPLAHEPPLQSVDACRPTDLCRLRWERGLG